MPTAPDTFLVTCGGIGAVGVDYVDAGDLPDEDIVYAFVHFRPRLPKGEVIWAPGLTPPRGIQLDPIRGRFSPEDGKLRTLVAKPVNEKQLITASGSPFTLNFDGQPTASIPNTATPTQVRTALEALPNIGVGNIYVTGENGGPWTAHFSGLLGGTNVPLMTATGATVTLHTQGAANEGVRLYANTDLLALDHLIYDLTFEVPNSDRTIRGFAILAPTETGQTIALETVDRLPHRDYLGI